MSLANCQSLRASHTSEEIRNASVENENPPQSNEKTLPNFDFILPKFHFILPNFYFAPPWGNFVYSLELPDFLRGIICSP